LTTGNHNSSKTTRLFAPGDRVRYRSHTSYGPTYGGVSLAGLVWRVEKVETDPDRALQRTLVFAESEGDDTLGVFDVPERFELVEEAPATEARAEPYAIEWLDLETDGLDPRSCGILEIAWILTRFAYPYEELVRGHRLVWSSHAERLVNGDADPFILDMHDKSGLRAALSEEKILPGSESRVERELLDLSAGWPLEDKDARVVLGGNSAHFDLGFLRIHMPTFAKRLSHRVFDVSAMLMQARSLGMPVPPKTEPAHRAMADVEHSIATARRLAEWHLERGFSSLPRSPTEGGIGAALEQARRDAAVAEWLSYHSAVQRYVGDLFRERQDLGSSPWEVFGIEGTSSASRIYSLRRSDRVVAFAIGDRALAEVFDHVGSRRGS
jgi:oligoribonuclease (3'-5' exoribonuclease)